MNLDVEEEQDDVPELIADGNSTVAATSSNPSILQGQPQHIEQPDIYDSPQGAKVPITIVTGQTTLKLPSCIAHTELTRK